MKSNKANPIQTTAFTTWMEADGIARTTVKRNAIITLKEAKENTEAISKLFTNKKFPLLIDARSIKYMDKAARDHFSLRNREYVLTAFAIINSSPVSHIIGNFFISLNKPEIPVKLFSSEEKAIQWLKKHL